MKNYLFLDICTYIIFIYKYYTYIYIYFTYIKKPHHKEKVQFYYIYIDVTTVYVAIIIIRRLLAHY